MKLTKGLALISLVVFLSACSTPTLPAAPTYTPYPTLAVAPTYTLFPTYTPYPTYTPFPTLPPTATVPAVSPTPRPTSTPLPTEDPALTADKSEGTWLVGVEVKVGKWRASGDCYAVTQDDKGESLDMADGPKSIIIVPATVFAVRFVSYPDKCTWSYIGK